ncbi:MAG: HAD-IA family hydrolase [Desulfobacteraceae bacterium]|nr:HAD-IA family hydrolase [Desulfobacteraceae bacterium]
MNILYYLEPWIEVDSPHMKFMNFKNQLADQIIPLLCENKDVKVSVILGDMTYSMIMESNHELIPHLNFFVISQRELKKVYPNYLEATHSWYHEDYSDEKSNLMQALIKNKLGDYSPDIILSFLSPAPFLKKLFPHAPLIYQEFGIFSRDPFPKSYYLDMHGIFSNSFLSKFSEELLHLPTSQKSIQFIGAIRKKLLKERLSATNPFRKKKFGKGSKFKYTVLLPLQFSNYFGFDCPSGFRTQFEYLTFVLDNIDPTIGVVVTQHNAWQKIITPARKKYLESRYSNFIYDFEFDKVPSISQYLLEKVDGVITVSSSIGLQALLWKLPLFVVGNSHLTNIADCKNISEVFNYLESPSKIDKDPALHFLLTHYYITEKYINNGKWLKKFLNTCIAKHKKDQLDFNSFEAIDANEDNILESIINKKGMNHSNIQKQASNGNLSSIRPSILNDKNLITKISSHPTISFDIFDTLIVRPFSFPHHVFTFMVPEVRKILDDNHFDFVYIRREYHQEAKKALCFEEITLDEIYDYIQKKCNWTNSQRNLIQQLEISMEIKLCKKRPYSYEIYKLVKSLGKKIIFISDMYLPKDVIAQILKMNGYYHYDNLFISSEHRMVKHSGTLYEYVLNKINESPFNILHFGDNFQSDIKKAQEYKIDGFYVKKPIECFSDNQYHQQIWGNDLHRKSFVTDKCKYSIPLMIGLFANKLYDNPRKMYDKTSLFNGSAYNLGYYGLGLSMVGFCKWIIQEANKNGIKKLFFLARDAYLIHKVYQEVSSEFKEYPKAKYIYASRRSLSIPSLKTNDDILELLSRPFRHKSTLMYLLKNRFALDDIQEIDKNLLEDNGFSSINNEISFLKDFQRIKNVVLGLSDQILQIAQKERELVLEYFSHIQLEGNNREAVIDLGYAGSIQGYINKILKNGNISGYYFITTRKILDVMDSGSTAKGYLAEFQDQYDNHNIKHPFFGYTLFFEAIFSSFEGSIIKFNKDAKGKIKPVLDSEVNLTQKNISNKNFLMSEIHRGVIDFSKDLTNSLGNNITQFDFAPNRSLKVINYFLTTPHYKDAKIFENFSLSDKNNGFDNLYIIKKIDSTNHKRISGKEKKEIWRQSYWKEGTLAMFKFISTTKNQKTKNKENNYQLTATAHYLEVENKLPLNTFQRKYNKFKRNRKLFFSDSKYLTLRFMGKLL